MDDFLHNLRSGKLKQPDRSNRPYNDQQFKGGPRRPLMDRRKRDFDNKDNLERIGVLKEVLENMADSQKRLVQALEARNKTEERKARAMELLAKNIYRMINPNAENVDALFAPQATSDAPASEMMTQSAEATVPESDSRYDQQEETVLNSESHEPISDQAEPLPAAFPEQIATARKSSKLTIIDQQALFPIIKGLREQGESWERIARHIADQGYPTISGKGLWRGVMIKNLFEKMSA